MLELRVPACCCDVQLPGGGVLTEHGVVGVPSSPLSAYHPSAITAPGSAAVPGEVYAVGGGGGGSVHVSPVPTPPVTPAGAAFVLSPVHASYRAHFQLTIGGMKLKLQEAEHVSLAVRLGNGMWKYERPAQRGKDIEWLEDEITEQTVTTEQLHTIELRLDVKKPLLVGPDLTIGARRHHACLTEFCVHHVCVCDAIPRWHAGRVTCDLHTAATGPVKQCLPVMDGPRKIGMLAFNVRMVESRTVTVVLQDITVLIPAECSEGIAITELRYYLGPTVHTVPFATRIHRLEPVRVV